jgi:hypothetical protein
MNPILRKSLVSAIKAISMILGAQGIDLPLADDEINYWLDIALMLWPLAHSIYNHFKNQRDLEHAKAGLL